MSNRIKAGIVSVGNGAASAECIIALRKCGYARDIHVVSDVDMAPYNPMLVTYYASTKIDEGMLFPFGGRDEFYRKYHVAFHPNSPAVKVDGVRHEVELENGDVLLYDKCLIASGAVPFTPFSIPDVLKDKVITVRTISDGEKLKNVLSERPAKVLVLGASMIGIKVLEALHSVGSNVIFADLAQHVFSLAAHVSCSQIIEKYLGDIGIQLRLGTAVREIVPGEECKCEVHFTDGGPNEVVDYVASCVGVRPNMPFIDRQQVKTDRGILVDTHLRTSCLDLYAAGDVAQGNDILIDGKRIIGLWANARMQGRTAGMNMAGLDREYIGSLPHNITHFMDMDFVGIGDVAHGDREFHFEDKSNRTLCHLTWTENRLTGINLLNMPELSGVLKDCLIHNLEGGLPNILSGNPLAMNRIYQKFPQLERELMKEVRG